MKGKNATVEEFWTAFRALPKSQRAAVVGRFANDKEFLSDLEDILLIDKSRRERGKDISLESL